VWWTRNDAQNIRILRAYGAEIELVSKPDPATGGFLQARIDRVQTLLQTIEDSFWTNQYGNLSNARAHYRTRWKRSRPNWTGGSTALRGHQHVWHAQRLRRVRSDHRLDTNIFAVDARGSVIFGGQPAERLIPGHGAARRPSFTEPTWRTSVRG